MAFKNEIGNKYGRLTVIRRATEEEYPRGSGKHVMWYCQCECGNHTFAQSSSLRNGKRVSCGCQSREKAVELARNLGMNNRFNLIGQKFGRLTVLEATHKPNHDGQYWICKCDCGAITRAIPTGFLTSGHTTSCGCSRQFADHHASKGEDRIASILNKNHIVFSREYIFSNLKGAKDTHLRYDFAIFKDGKLQYLCEYDGIQHFKQVAAFQPYRKDFLKTQGHDRQKNSYALANDIPLYRIPYWELDTLHSLNDIITEKHRVKSKYHNDDLTPP